MPYRDPEQRRAFDRQRKRERRAGRPPVRPTVQPALAELQLQTARDVLRLLEEQIGLVRDDAELGALERARCIGYLAAIVLRAIEAGDVAARLEALEAVLKQRPKPENTKP